jgi:hypothetical protein
MARFYMKMIWFGLMLIFCVFFGVSLATTGIERIQGPLSHNPSPVGTVKPATAAVVTPRSDSSNSKEQQEMRPIPVKGKTPAEVEQHSLNFVGNKLGDLLQIVSHHGIKWFVSLFDSVLGKG